MKLFHGRIPLLRWKSRTRPASRWQPVLCWPGKQETIGFDVAGLVEFVKEQGDNVEGPVFDANETLIRPAE